MSNAQSSNTSSSTIQNTIPFAPTKESFTKHSGFIVAIKPETVREARVDLNAVFVRTLTVLAALHEMRPLIVARLPDVDLPTYDSIEERIYAAHYCNTLWQAKVDAQEDVGALADVLEDRYDDALAAYEILIKFRLANAEPKGRLKTTGGYDALTHNAGLVLGVLRGLAPDVLSQTPLKPRDLEQLEHDLLAFQAAWGRREYTEHTRNEAAVLRAQAFTYLYEAYEIARRAAMYLYGYERGNELVPSLFTSNGERKRQVSGGNDPTASAPNTGDSETPEASASGQAAKTSPRDNAVSPATFVMDNTANLPLTNPFDLSSETK